MQKAGECNNSRLLVIAGVGDTGPELVANLTGKFQGSPESICRILCIFSRFAGRRPGLAGAVPALPINYRRYGPNCRWKAI